MVTPIPESLLSGLVFVTYYIPRVGSFVLLALHDWHVFQINKRFVERCARPLNDSAVISGSFWAQVTFSVLGRPAVAFDDILHLSASSKMV